MFIIYDYYDEEGYGEFLWTCAYSLYFSEISIMPAYSDPDVDLPIISVDDEETQELFLTPTTELEY